MDQQLALPSLDFGCPCAGSLHDLAALLLRVSLGTMFIAHLYWKLHVVEGGFRKWWSEFEADGNPRPVAYYVVSAEILGALLLIPGIGSRWVCLYALASISSGAAFWPVRTGFFFGRAGCELPFAWTIMLLVQALLGDGALALGPLM